MNLVELNQPCIFTDMTEDYLNQGYSQSEAEAMASSFVEFSC
tara:strand:+ start:675 stop:800 length:126 start_codon:yes stop_codon:yes gene_type:complete